MPRHEDIIERVTRYYTEKFREFGAVPQGADWNSAESQQARFEQLLAPLRMEEPFSLLDYGCGYGALFTLLAERYRSIEYTGLDIAPAMLKAAAANIDEPSAAWTTTLPPDAEFDYVVASGLFNVRQDVDPQEWEAYIWNTLDRMWGHTRRAMSFNVLTSDHDPGYEKDYLYYARPEHFLRQCIDRYSRNVALNQDYGLYEFTLSIRKSDE